MNYARVVDGIVREIIPAVHPAFPTIPIEKRFHKSIIAQLIEVPENMDVAEFWTYSIETGFVAPIVPKEEYIEEANEISE